MLNVNIPAFKCVVRQSYFTKNPNDASLYHDCYAFAVQSVSMKMLTFHVMTDYGMLRSRVPLSEIYLTPPQQDIPYYYKQLWDCFGEQCAVTSLEFLKEKRAQVLLRDKQKIWATYLFTIDWFNNPYSDEPSDYKCGHVLAADDGYLLCQPNNRLFWRDSNWVTKTFPIALKDIKVDSDHLSVETVADRWVTEDTDSVYYAIDAVKSREP